MGLIAQTKTMFKSVLHWVARTRPYLFVVRDILPYARISWGHTRLTGKKYREGYKLLKPGHIILSTDEERISSFLTPGDLDHAAICVGVGSDYEIGEMTHLGYTQSLFFDICHTSDRVVILDCTDWDDEYKQRVIEKCRSLVGMQYDFQFEVGDTVLYCSELVFCCDIEKRLEMVFGDYILPEDIYKAKNVKVIWDSDA
ncbi:MAG: YiiX/YebB-like N1pC/P60 family cysteine hydrolase [Candidatus Omnitrophota bacterium]|jgi:hypothetical protein